MSFFGVNVNPFSTQVGQKIEQATDGGLPSENWALNMEICDIINETEDGPRDGIKAIKKRLTQAAGKNYTIVMYTLTVLETCVKNCGKRFHTLACAREFITELVKMIGPKNEPPTVVQEKVLSLIQTWADAFQNQPHTQGVVQVYQELKAKGMQFPMTDLDSMAPILTPERSVPETMTAINQHEQINICDSIANQQQIQSSPQLLSSSSSSSSPIRLKEQQIKKLKSEIDVVQGNMRVLGEMLQFFTDNCKQGTTKPDDNDMELLHQLYSTCRSMQERIVELVGKLVDDELTAELLCINDELNNLFLRYSRYTKNKTATSASTILAQTIGQSSIASIDNDTTFKRPEKSLIDLDEDDDNIHQNKDVLGIQQKIGALGFYGDGAKSKNIEKEQPDSDEFDMFAQSRTATYETTKNSGSKYEDNLEDIDSGSLSTAIFNRGAGTVASDTTNLLDISAPNPTRPTIPNQETEFNEMAAWLDNNATSKENSDQESLTSSEFERFLAERAAAADALPTLPTVTASPSTTATTTTTTTTNIQRQINKDQDKSLFAL